jgi:hypothetical protein
LLLSLSLFSPLFLLRLHLLLLWWWLFFGLLFLRGRRILLLWFWVCVRLFFSCGLLRLLTRGIFRRTRCVLYRDAGRNKVGEFYVELAAYSKLEAVLKLVSPLSLLLFLIWLFLRLSLGLLLWLLALLLSL